MTPEQQRKRYQRAKDHIQEEIPEKLYCKRCDRWIEEPEKNFPKNPLCTYGLAKTCKECKQKIQDINRKNHPGKHAASMQKRRAANPEHTREIDHACKERNRERFREQEQERRRINPEQFRRNRWRYNHSPYGKLKSRVYSRNRKMLKKGLEGTYTDQDIQDRFSRQKGKCYWCHAKLTTYDVDHIIPITRPGSSNHPYNLVLACPICNQSRGKKLPHEWSKYPRLF
jgi:5-methylcytosine-specific restriction endonuclease McrA